MSIDDQGFLSETDILQYRDQIRQRYARYFDFIHRVNTFCLQAKFRLNDTSTDSQNRMAVRLLVKLLADTQGAVLLVERGLASQARTLLRAACETCIILARVCQKKDFQRLYSLSDTLTLTRWNIEILKDKSPALKSIREEFSRRGITLKTLTQREGELKKSGAKKLQIGALAEAAGLSGLYYSAFSLYCQDTHSSTYVLDQYPIPSQFGNFEDNLGGSVMDNLEDMVWCTV